MGKIWMPGGGGGVDSDDCTATKDKVLSGYTAVTKDSDDEAAVGTMANYGAVSQALNAGGSYTISAGYHNGSGKVTANSLSSQTGGATAGDSDVLSGKTYWKDGAKQTGTMANQGAKTSALNAGGSYTIPAGYHNGAGKVTANSLSSQTSATAAAAQILSGQTAWVNGSKLTGSMANQGTKTSALNCGGSYTIPAGYHSGSGKVTANSLASQTSATAAAGHIISGQTAWVNGSKITGTIPQQHANDDGSDRAWATGASCWDQRINLGVRNGHYLNGVNWITAHIPNFTPANIKKGVNIGGVVGTHSGFVATSADIYNYGAEYYPFELADVSSPADGRLRYRKDSTCVMVYKDIPSSGYQSGSACFTTVNKLNLNNYRTITLSLDYVKRFEGLSSFTVKLGVGDAKYANTNYASYASLSMTNSNTPTGTNIITLDVSSYAGDYYVKVGLSGGTPGFGEFIHLRKITLYV